MPSRAGTEPTGRGRAFDPSKTGIDRLLEAPEAWTGGRRVALLANQASLTYDGCPTLDALRAHPRVDLAALFAAEHGWSGFGPDATPVADDRDVRTGLPVHSLYGPRRRPDAGQLTDLDAVVVDLVEVGVRCYTFAASVALLLEAAADTGTRVVVCDRPARLGGDVRGPMLDPALRSFLGYLPLPYQHGLTLGEIARWYASTHLGGGVDLVVVPAAEGRIAPSRAGPWVPPSPALSTREAFLLYPGLVLLEGTNLSEGRGTPLPFQLIGAPWLDGYELAEAIQAMSLPGLLARPVDFVPESGPYEGRACHGVQLHVVEPGQLDALTAATAILSHLRASRAAFSWVGADTQAWRHHPDAGQPWHEPGQGPLIDWLTGSDELRLAIDGQRDPGALRRAWRVQHARFLEDVRPFLLHSPPPQPA